VAFSSSRGVAIKVKYYLLVPTIIITLAVLSCDSNDPKTISASATSYRNESGELVGRDATKAEIESIDRFYERIQKIEKKYPAPPIPLNQETFAVSSINEDGVFILGILGTGIDILIDKMGFCGYLNGHATKSQN